MTLSLRIQAALAQYVTDAAHAGVFATDTDLRITLWNRWMEMQTRRPASEVVGQPLLSLFPDLACRGMDAYYAEALEHGRVTTLSHALHGYVLAMPATQPEIGTLEMPQSGRIAPIRDGETIVGTITVIENVSERLASEMELRRQIRAQEEARATAERALRDKDEFLSTLSHELRTPLNAVLGWTRIILSRKTTHPSDIRPLQIIERNAAAQAAMIDDILDVARIVSGKLRLETSPTDLAPLVMAAVDVVTPSARAKRLTITTYVVEGAPPVLGDAGRLQQIVWNLLSNAVKFSDPGGEIAVTLTARGDQVRLEVADNGRGIAPALLPYVFDRFRQGDASSARRQGGLGLGLALARDLVHLHGGTIRAASAGEQKGSTFTIELPALVGAVAQDATAGAPQVRASAGVSPLSGVRALVVEDEADSRELIADVLTEAGAEVVAVDSSEAAILRLTDVQPVRFDVLVSDIGMPEYDGYELIRRIRKLPGAAVANIAAVAVTGYATSNDRERSSSAGYHVHVAKPIEPAALAAEVLRAIQEATLTS